MRKNISILLLLAFLFSKKTDAQFEITTPKWYPAVKYNKLYVYMGDTSKPHSKKIMNIVRENWKLCQVVFAYGQPDASLIIPGNLFLRVSSLSKTTQYIRGYWAGQRDYKGTTFSNDYYYLSLEASNNPGPSSKNELDMVARAELYLKTITYGGQDEVEKAFKKDLKKSGILYKKESTYDLADVDFKYVYLNGNPGNIKNMIQYVSSQLGEGKSSKLLEENSSAAEITKLKQDTLYVPNYWYGEDGLTMESLDHESKPYKITVKYVEDMIAAYPYKIKLVSREELNNKILQANKDFYYYSYIQCSANKIVSVINGHTGNVVYKEVTRLKYRPTEKDFETLGKTVEKSN
ncbi:MAG: hypothetical protein JNK27_01600 [Chitinophagaceae bacterium]|nr:hypothetical protein [Chitinophagaceae bacterium]